MALEIAQAFSIRMVHSSRILRILGVLNFATVGLGKQRTVNNDLRGFKFPGTLKKIGKFIILLVLLVSFSARHTFPMQKKKKKTNIKYTGLKRSRNCRGERIHEKLCTTN